MGMMVNVYRNPLGDCTNGGISADAKYLTLTNVDGPFEPNKLAPAAVLEQHVPGCLRIVPPEGARSRGIYMSGGNYAATSDSRFSEACERLLGHCFYGAVSIHDRTESGAA
jgi:hypothetical protein